MEKEFSFITVSLKLRFYGTFLKVLVQKATTNARIWDMHFLDNLSSLFEM